MAHNLNRWPSLPRQTPAGVEDALGAEQGLGMQMADIMRAAASDVTAGLIPNSGHWIMQENPIATVQLVQVFIEKP
jgi:pimeloyl-ACP methyl ester carboxylesterase